MIEDLFTDKNDISKNKFQIAHEIIADRFVWVVSLSFFTGDSKGEAKLLTSFLSAFFFEL